MALYEALCGKRCRLLVCWDDIREKRITGPELVQVTLEKVPLIKERIKATQDRQKSWVDNKRRPLAFEVGEKVYLNVFPMKGVMQFSKSEKLSPRYVGLFEIIEKVGDLAYKLALLPVLSWVHNVFHVSQLRKYVLDSSRVGGRAIKSIRESIV